MNWFEGADNKNMDALVARQAIFDRSLNVFGYELLFRSCKINEFDALAASPDDSQATSQVIANGLLEIGLEKLLSGRKAFVNFGRNLLVREPLLPKELMVIEVLETVNVDDAVLEACRELKHKGYTIALDDFVCDGRFDRLIQYADIIKMDFQATPREQQKLLVQHYSKRGIQMLAEKVETIEEYEWARGIGYQYFQGYFFARPTILHVKRIAPSKVGALRLLQELQKPELNHHRLESLIKQDVAFSFKLLRYVNSAAFTFQNPIRSIQHALRILGDDETRRWTTLVVLPGIAKDKPDEIITHSLVRARFCELLGSTVDSRVGEADPFLTGMFSLLDAMIDRPLDEIAKELNLHSDMRSALLDTVACKLPAAAFLRLVMAYEAADWKTVQRESACLRISGGKVALFYMDSLKWVDQLLDMDEDSERKTA